MELLFDLVHFFVAGAVSLLAVLTQAWMMAFFCDVISPITVDRSPTWHQPPSIINNYPLLNNLLLLLFFTVPHSAMLRGPVKAIVDYAVPKRYFRNFYVFMASALLLATMYLWQPVPAIVWSVETPFLRNGLQGLTFFSWLLTSVALLNLNPFDLLGFTEPILKLFGLLRNSDSPSKPKLVDTGAYGLVRHPVYAALLSGVWITPTMTVGHALIASVFTLYTVLAVKYYEEPDLVKLFGQEYIDYMKRIPGYFPSPSLIWRKALSKKE